MNRKATVFLIIALSTLTSFYASAWEQTYPRGPVRFSQPAQEKTGVKEEKVRNEKIRTVGPALSAVPKGLREAAGHPNVGNILSVRTVTYPSQHGAFVGMGWDFIINQKKYDSCITFDVIEENKYQTANVTFQEVTDDETLEITLNTEFSGSVEGTIEMIDAKAEATSTLNALHRTKSNDLVFTSHASVTSGIKYAWKKEGNHQSVKLKPDMEQLARKDPQSFRQRCGDGFVGSVGYGADLNLLLHFHHLSTQDRLELSFDSKASAGVADVFGASGSSKLKSTIDKLSERGLLEINFIQNGGIIEAIPTNLAEARTKVQGLAKEEFAGPRPIFLGIVPYSELPNWPGYYLLDTADVRQRAIRYAIRLKSIYYEVLNIREDYYRDRASLPPIPDCSPGGLCKGASVASDLYFYSYRHKLRNEDLGRIAKAIADQIDIVRNLLAVLNSRECNPKPVAVASSDREGARSFVRSLEAFSNSKVECEKASKELIALTQNFDDYSYWSQLPIPQNSLPQSAIDLIVNGSADVTVRKTNYAQYVFRHWVERIDQIRCRLFDECLTADEKKHIYETAILQSMNEEKPSGGTVLIGKHTFCTGEYDAGHPRADPGCRAEVRLGCSARSEANFERVSRDFCEVKSGAYSHAYTPVGGSINGNECGYQNFEVSCFSFQPSFP